MATTTLESTWELEAYIYLDLCGCHLRLMIHTKSLETRLPEAEEEQGGASADFAEILAV